MGYASSGAATERLKKLIVEVYKRGSVTHTVSMAGRSALWPKILVNTAPTISTAEIRQAALLGYLAVAKDEDRQVFTVTGLGRAAAGIVQKARSPVYRVGLCPKCGVQAEHWVPADPQMKTSVGFWMCDMEGYE